MSKQEEKLKCAECDKPYEPDQYYAWCNKCGEKIEKEWFDNSEQCYQSHKLNCPTLIVLFWGQPIKAIATIWIVTNC